MIRGEDSDSSVDYNLHWVICGRNEIPCNYLDYEYKLHTITKNKDKNTCLFSYFEPFIEQLGTQVVHHWMKASPWLLTVREMRTPVPQNKTDKQNKKTGKKERLTFNKIEGRGRGGGTGQQKKRSVGQVYTR